MSWKGAVLQITLKKKKNLSEQLEDPDPVVDELILDIALAAYGNQILPE